MAHSEEVKLSCSCGAQMIYSERVEGSLYSHTSYRVKNFLEAHEVCRQRATEDVDLKRLLAFNQSKKE